MLFFFWSMLSSDHSRTSSFAQWSRKMNKALFLSVRFCWSAAVGTRTSGLFREEGWSLRRSRVALRCERSLRRWVKRTQARTEFYLFRLWVIKKNLTLLLKQPLVLTLLLLLLWLVLETAVVVAQSLRGLVAFPSPCWFRTTCSLLRLQSNLGSSLDSFAFTDPHKVHVTGPLHTEFRGDGRHLSPVKCIWVRKWQLWKRHNYPSGIRKSSDYKKSYVMCSI